MKTILISFLLLVALGLVFDRQTKSLWVYLTAVRVHNETELIKAVENADRLPWWRAKVIIIKARNLTFRDVVLPSNFTVVFEGWGDNIYPNWWGAHEIKNIDTSDGTEYGIEIFKRIQE